MRGIRNCTKTTGGGSDKCWHDGKKTSIKKNCYKQKTGQGIVLHGHSEKCFTDSGKEEAFRAKVLDAWIFKQQLQSHYSGNLKVHENNRWRLRHVIVIESDVLKRTVKLYKLRTPNWAQIKAVTRKYALATYMGELGLKIGPVKFK